MSVTVSVAALYATVAVTEPPDAFLRIKLLAEIDPDWIASLNVALIPKVTDTPVELAGGLAVLTVGPTVVNDQVTGPVPDAQLLDFINEHPYVQQCADGLGQFALDNGSRDNVSCIVIEVAEGR